MSKRAKPVLQEEVAPNLIPMVDIMFLLLLFFMLSADMSQRELEDVILPKAVSVKEDKETAKGHERLTINIFHKYSNEVVCEVYKQAQKDRTAGIAHVCYEKSHWRVSIKGHDFADPKLLGQRIKKEADEQRDPATGISEKKCMIRGDLAAPFGLVQEAMNQCAFAGIYKIECGAASPKKK